MTRAVPCVAALLLLASVIAIGNAAPIKVVFGSLRQSGLSGALDLDPEESDLTESPEPSESPEAPEDMLLENAAVTVPTSVTAPETTTTAALAVTTFKTIPAEVDDSGNFVDLYTFDGQK